MVYKSWCVIALKFSMGAKKQAVKSGRESEFETNRPKGEKKKENNHSRRE